MFKQKLLLILFAASLTVAVAVAAVAEKPFTIVIDPGHGGKDPGALGSLVQEKDIILDVALRFGQLIKREHPDVKVIYTRNTDVFIPLQQRASIANKANANLFISIHADYADNKSAKGPTTFTLGQNRSKENFEIAKRENSVILLEDNYEKRYEGFDPNSAESYIMFEFMQDNYMTQSIELASMIQQKFKDSGRIDRGVRQDVFLVLRNTSMPSVLVELGFLTNKEEELYLKSNKGKDEMAACLLKAFSNFKADYDRKSVNKPVEAKKRPKQEDSLTNQTTGQTESIDFRIQLFVSSTKLPEKDSRFKGYSVNHYIENGYYKYTTGHYNAFDAAETNRKKLLRDFPDAFIIAFKNGTRMAVAEAVSNTNHEKTNQ